MLAMAAAAFVVLFILLKLLYPQPDFFVDSLTYIDDAIRKLSISYRPVGYCDFLGICHAISNNINFTVFIQYLLFFVSTLVCFFSADYLYGFPPKARMIVFWVALLNPILLLQTNLISSDSLFCSLTVLWFTSCLWLLRKGTIAMLATQTILLMLCFHVRYTAIFYPIVPLVVYVIARHKAWFKMAGIAIMAICLLVYVQNKRSFLEEKLGQPIFSGFSGWQIANNVLCYYKHINLDNEDMPNEECQYINELVKAGIDSFYKEGDVGTTYIWNRQSPIKRYLYTRMQRFGGSYGQQWMATSIELDNFGKAAIKAAPMAYIRYYMLNNARYFMLPDKEILASYNNGNVTIPTPAVQWYDMDTDRPECRFPGVQLVIASVYPFISMLINLFNLAVVVIIIRRAIAVKGKNMAANWVWITFYISFSLFSIASTIVLMRYLDPIYALGIIIPIALLHTLQKPSDVVS